MTGFILLKNWDFSFISGTNLIDVHINSHRNKIYKNFSPANSYTSWIWLCYERRRRIQLIES